MNILSLHCTNLNITYWFFFFFNVPDQLSWRRQRHPWNNSAVEKLSQTAFVVLEGRRWWLNYELPSSNTSGTCGYKQHFCYTLATFEFEVKHMPTWVGPISDSFWSKRLSAFYKGLWIYKWYNYMGQVELNVQQRISGKWSSNLLLSSNSR